MAPFNPQPGDTVLAPHQRDAVSGAKHPVEFVRRFKDRGYDRIQVRDDSGTWDVDASTVEAPPSP